jgi:transposase-like protein
MARDPAARRRYTDQQREEALIACKANGNDVQRTAAALGIPVRTLRSWLAGSRHPEAREGARMDAQEKAQSLAERLDAAALALLDAALERPRVEASTTKELIVAMAVTIDKSQLLKARPTSYQVIDNRSDGLAAAVLTDPQARELATSLLERISNHQPPPNGEQQRQENP